MNIAFDLLIISKCMFSYILYISSCIIWCIFRWNILPHKCNNSSIPIEPYFRYGSNIQRCNKTIKNESYSYNQTYMYVFKNSEHIFCKTHALFWNIWTRLTCWCCCIHQTSFECFLHPTFQVKPLGTTGDRDNQLWWL